VTGSAATSSGLPRLDGERDELLGKLTLLRERQVAESHRRRTLEGASGQRAGAPVAATERRVGAEQVDAPVLAWVDPRARHRDEDPLGLLGVAVAREQRPLRHRDQRLGVDGELPCPLEALVGERDLPHAPKVVRRPRAEVPARDGPPAALVRLDHSEVLDRARSVPGARARRHRVPVRVGPELLVVELCGDTQHVVDVRLHLVVAAELERGLRPHREQVGPAPRSIGDLAQCLVQSLDRALHVAARVLDPHRTVGSEPRGRRAHPEPVVDGGCL
jgi:hypothetical protein